VGSNAVAGLPASNRPPRPGAELPDMIPIFVSL
jgi:hypothetical protein